MIRCPSMAHIWKFALAQRLGLGRAQYLHGNRSFTASTYRQLTIVDFIVLEDTVSSALLKFEFLKLTLNTFAMRLFQVSLIVRDYDEAIRFYVERLGFELLEDTALTDTKRWVRVAPPNSNAVCLLLARAANDEQIKSVGSQTGGRVFLFFETDDIQHAIARCERNGVPIIQPLRDETYGKVIVIADLYGNKIDIIQPHR